MIIHIDTLCETASLSCEFAEFLDSVHFMKQTQIHNRIVKSYEYEKLAAQTLQANVIAGCYAEWVEVKRQ